MFSHSHKTFPISESQRRTPSYRCLGCYPYVTWMLEFPYPQETDDKNRVDIASLGHYGESYSRSASL